MSDRTSHRRRARQRHTQNVRAGVEAYIQMCEKCSRERAYRQFGDLLVCGTCRASFPVLQPWRICPESGEYLDTRTGKPFVYDDEAVR